MFAASLARTDCPQMAAERGDRFVWRPVGGIVDRPCELTVKGLKSGKIASSHSLLIPPGGRSIPYCLEKVIRNRRATKLAAETTMSRTLRRRLMLDSIDFLDTCGLLHSPDALLNPMAEGVAT